MNIIRFALAILLGFGLIVSIDPQPDAGGAYPIPATETYPAPVPSMTPTM